LKRVLFPAFGGPKIETTKSGLAAVELERETKKFVDIVYFSADITHLVEIRFPSIFEEKELEEYSSMVKFKLMLIFNFVDA